MGSSLYADCDSDVMLLLSRQVAHVVSREQAFNDNSDGSGSSSDSGSSPEADSSEAAPAAAATAETLADGATMGQDKTLLAGIELGLDVLGSSTQWVVAGAVGVALVSRADVGTFVYVLGSLINAVFSKVLKKTINQVWVGVAGAFTRSGISLVVQSLPLSQLLKRLLFMPVDGRQGTHQLSVPPRDRCARTGRSFQTQGCPARMPW